MKKICIIPLDSRPCNTVWLEQLAREAGFATVMYPRSLCGNLHRGADFVGMMTMIKENVDDCDYLLLAADGLLSGGLVQARLGEIDVDAVLSGLSGFADYKKSNPRLRIYVFDTLMRTSITSYDKESSRYWSLVNEYSVLLGRYQSGALAVRPELAKLEKQIPPALLKRYLRARRIKHRLNMQMLKMVKNDIIDYLIILQEDTCPEGIQKIEQKKIEHYITVNNLGKRVKTYNGTDEGGLLLLARIVNECYRIKPKIHLFLPYKNALEKTMPFEDRLFIDNLRGMFETGGFVFVDDDVAADFILAVYTEKHNRDLDLNEFKEELPAVNAPEYQRFITGLNNYLKAGKNVALVDLLFPNGGSPQLLQAVLYRKLRVYSAWNTASNAMGSALCEIAVLCARPQVNHTLFRDGRILDDCIYQYYVRRRINQQLAMKGCNIFDLKGDSPEVTERISAEMEKYRYLVNNRRFTLSLPWQRTFEIDIEIEE